MIAQIRMLRALAKALGEQAFDLPASERRVLRALALAHHTAADALEDEERARLAAPATPNPPASGVAS